MFGHLTVNMLGVFYKYMERFETENRKSRPKKRWRYNFRYVVDDDKFTGESKVQGEKELERICAVVG